MFEMKLDHQQLRRLMSMMHDCLYARSYEDMHKIVDNLSDVIPFNAAILCKVEKTDGTFVLSESLNHSYPVEWVRAYFSNKLFEFDPVVHRINENQKPVTWETAYQGVELTSQSKEFIGMAEDFGLRDGVTASCNTLRAEQSNSLISLETTGISVNDDFLQVVEYILPHFHEMLFTLEANSQIPNEIPKFTVREKETLKWAYEGKTAWEIGIILSISERTVKFHLNNIYQKLNVTNRSQAVAKAIRYGIV